MKMIRVDRKGRNCLLILNSTFGSLGPNKLLLMLVLRSQQRWLEVLQQRSLVRQSQINLSQYAGKMRVFCDPQYLGIRTPFLKKRGPSPVFRVRKGAVAGCLSCSHCSAAQHTGSGFVPSFQGSCLDPAVVSALCCSPGNAPTLHLENLSIHRVRL